MGERLYLYGIFPAPGPQHLALTGLDNQPIDSHTIEEFTFLFSAAKQERYLASRRNLLGHERVLEAAMQAGFQTLLPLQFGLTTEAWEPVQQELLVPNRDRLKQLFAKLQGRREVSIKVMWEPDQELETLMRENEALRLERDRLQGKQLRMEEVIGIGQAIEQAMEARKLDIIQALRTALNPLAAEVIENEPMTSAMIYNAAYLISWDEEIAFGEQVEALDAQFEERLRIRYNSFTAPYNFSYLAQP
ncbi:gas vesicle protein GvpF [Almyronema epifaneia]|uniref:GvpL/GvpF family gas vesicle protein n=1 Tax=Almyronema epifaneia S1 TaxID=2991925 RepID=A0ABW6ID83_9CYAN